MPYVEPIVVFSSKETKLIIEKNPERCKILQIKDLEDSSLYDYIMEYDYVFSTEEIETIVQFLKTKIL